MKGPLREIDPGETFYLLGEKINYHGVVITGDEPVHVYWIWNKYKRRRSYRAVPQWRFEQEWQYMTKTKPKRKLIY